MAEIATAAGTGNQVVGKVFILYGTVKAVSPDGTVHVLAPNSPIYADDHIITGSDGSVSIQFDGPPVTQLDLGRMTEIVIDQDVYAGVTPEVVSEAAAQAEQVQESLLQGDQPIDLEATAAGGAAGAGGGHPVVNFALDGSEINVTSGAGTEGITTTTVGTLGGVFAGDHPTIIATSDATVDETGGLDTVKGTLAFNFGTDGPGAIVLSADGATWNAGTLTLTATDGTWQAVVNGDGTYTFTQLLAMDHPDATNPDDVIKINITATVADVDGDSVSQGIVINVLDDGPSISIISEQEGGDLHVVEGSCHGKVDFGHLDSNYGEDGAGTVALSATGAEWDPNSFTLTEDNGAWKMVLDPESGEYTFTLLKGIDNSVSDYIYVKATVTDADHDSASDTITIQVVDGDPSICLFTSNFVTESHGLDTVDGLLWFNYGADGAGNVELSTNLSGGDAVWNGGDKTLSWTAEGDTSPSWTMVVNDNGTYTFTQLQAMDHPDTGISDYVININITATVTDSDGSSVDHSASILVFDDEPTAHNDIGGKVVEDSTSQNVITGDVLANDHPGADTPAAFVEWGHSTADQNAQAALGNYGELVLNTDGTYSFTLDNSLPAVQALDTGETIIKQLHYTMQDADGDTDTATLTIKIGGMNDAPEVHADTNWAQEDTSDASGNVLVNIDHTHLTTGDFADVADTDVDDVLKVTKIDGSVNDEQFVIGNGTTATVVAGSYGTLSILSTGAYTYNVDNANATVNALNDGGTIHDTFTYTVSDGDATRTATLDVTIFGTNDAPTVDIWNDSNNNGTFESASDNQTEIIPVNIATDSNLPGTENTFIGKLLAEGTDVSELIAGNPPATTVLTHASDVTVTFLSEGAGYQNTVGWYDVNDPNHTGHVIWANASEQGSDGNLNGNNTPGANSTFVIPNVPAGTQLGFFMIPDAHSPDGQSTTTLPADGIIYFKNGHAYTDEACTLEHRINSTDNNMTGDTDPTWFSNSNPSAPSVYNNLDGLQHVITGVAPGESHTLYVGFEDLGNGGDKDYNDVVFKVDLGESNTIQHNPASFDVGVMIQDVDSAMMSKAVISFTLGAGDVVSYDESTVATLNVVHSGAVYTITGPASVETYNTLLDSFHIEIGNSGTNQNYLDISPVTRTADLQVWDASGTESAHDIAHFDLQLNIVGSTGNETLTGGAGDDILTGGAGADTFVVGQGHDHIVDYTKVQVDKVDISNVLNTAEGDHSRLAVVNDAGHAELVIYDATHTSEIGSVTFDNIDFNTLTPGDQLNSLLGQVDLDHTVL